MNILKVGEEVVGCFLDQNGFGCTLKELCLFLKRERRTWQWCFLAFLNLVALLAIIIVRRNWYDDMPFVVNDVVSPCLFLSGMISMIVFWIRKLLVSGYQFRYERGAAIELKKCLKKFVASFGDKILKCENQLGLSHVKTAVIQRLVKKARQILDFNIAKRKAQEQKAREEFKAMFDIGQKFFSLDYPKIFKSAETGQGYSSPL